MKEKKETVECSGCGEMLKESYPRCKCGKPRVVVCAANRSLITGRIVAGARHWDSIMRQQVINPNRVTGESAMPREWAGAEQGFIDQWGQWMTREEAWEVAKSQGQIKYPNGVENGTLFSEDLY